MPKTEGKIMVIDDNAEILLSIELLLKKHFSKVQTLRTPTQLSSLLEKERFDVYILDMNFSAEVKSGNEGLYWMKQILSVDPDASIIFITAFAGIELAVKAIREGALDFIEKPWDNRKLVVTLQNALSLKKAKQQVGLLKSRQKKLNNPADGQDQMVRGNSTAMQKVYEIIEKAAVTEANILIMGENGTGKEYLAREIHKLSHRRDEAFLHVDIGTLPPTLFESELFGHIRGAYTHAHEDRAGRFELASGGTLFLDEIGNLNVSLQAKLLQAIQNKTITRIGSNDPVQTDIRLICATNQPLHEMVKEGSFREDLLYRINTVRIDVPPLRERESDLPLLANFFLDKFCRKYQKTGLLIPDNIMKKICSYHWPGNIRQLQNVMENAVVLADENALRFSDFLLNKEMPPSGSLSQTKNYYEHEKVLILSVLQRTNRNLSQAAQELGLARSTLYRKIKKYGLQ
jgi:DNA-binding NtrC family response regulator